MSDYLIVGAAIGLVFAVAGLGVAMYAAWIDTRNEEQ